MGSLWIVWAKFFVSAFLVVLGGIRLVRYADIVSDKIGLNKTWTGMIILGVVTSFPELAASFSSAVFINAPDLAVGNITGSVNINLMIIVLMDILYRKGSVTSQIKNIRAYEFSAEFYSIMASVMVIEIFLSFYLKIFALGPISYGNILIFLIYILGAKTIFQSTSEGVHVAAAPSSQKEESYQKALQKLIVSAAVVVLGGLWLSTSCDEIAQKTLLGQTFVGAVFMGFITSLPEIVVSLTALKMGAFDLAFGNVFGSNIFNILILSVCDLFYLRGPLFARVSPTHILIMALSILVTTILIIGIQSPKKKTYFGLGLDTIFMLICFAIGMKFLYDLR